MASRGLQSLPDDPRRDVEQVLGPPPPYGEVGRMLGLDKWSRLNAFVKYAITRGCRKYWEMQRAGLTKEYPAEMKWLSEIYDEAFYKGEPAYVIDDGDYCAPGVRGERKQRCSFVPCRSRRAASNEALGMLARGKRVVFLGCSESGKAVLERLQQCDYESYKIAILDEDHYIAKKYVREADDSERPAHLSPPETTFSVLAAEATSLGVAEGVVKKAEEAAAAAMEGYVLESQCNEEGAEDSESEVMALGGQTVLSDTLGFGAKIDPLKTAMEAAYQDLSRHRPHGDILQVAQANYDLGVYKFPLRVTQSRYLQLRTDETSAMSHSRTLLVAAGGVGKSLLMVMEILKALLDADKRDDRRPLLVTVLTHRKKLVTQLLKDIVMGLYDQDVTIVYRDDEDKDSLKGPTRPKKRRIGTVSTPVADPPGHLDSNVVTDPNKRRCAAAVGLSPSSSNLSPEALGDRRLSEEPPAVGFDIQGYILEAFDEVRAFTATPQKSENARRYYDRFGILTVSPRICALLGVLTFADEDDGGEGGGSRFTGGTSRWTASSSPPWERKVGTETFQGPLRRSAQGCNCLLGRCGGRGKVQFERRRACA